MNLFTMNHINDTLRHTSQSIPHSYAANSNPQSSQTQIRSHAQKVLHGIKLKGMKDVSEEQIDKLIQKAKDRISSRIPDTTCLNKVTCIQSASKTTTTTTTMKKKVGIANKAKNGNRGASKSKQKRKFAFLPRKTNKPDPLPISSHVAAALCSLSSHGEIPNDEHCSPAAEAAGALCFLAGLKASSSSSSSPLTPTTDFGDTSSVVAVGALCKLSSPTRTAPTDERRLDAALAICNLVPHSQSPSPGTLQHSRLPAADTSGSSSANSSTIQQVPLSLPIKPNTKRLSSNNRSRKGNNPPAKRVKINHNTTKRKTIAVVSADISSITTALPSITSSTTTEPSTSSQPVPHHIMFVPTREEMLEMRTPRKRNALETWYERFNELYEYKIRHGDSKYERTNNDDNNNIDNHDNISPPLRMGWMIMSCVCFGERRDAKTDLRVSGHLKFSLMQTVLFPIPCCSTHQTVHLPNPWK